MSDVTIILSSAADFLHLPAVDGRAVDADLARGRRALARRTRRTATRGVLALAAVSAAVVVGVGTGHSDHRTTTADRGSPSPGSAALVAYTGPQPDSFKVDTVPSGWTVLQSDASTLLIGPATQSADPTTSSDGMTPVFGDIHVASVDAPDAIPDRTPIKVGDATGYWGTYLGGDGTHGLSFPSGTHTIQIQIPRALHWSAKDAAAFAQGLHIPTHPVTTHG